MTNHLIIAATSTIGQKLVDILSKNSENKLFLTGRDEETLKNLAENYNANYAVLEDAANFDAVLEVFSKAKDELGNVDSVACLSGNLMLKPAHLTKESELEETLKANIYPAFATVAAAGKNIRKGGNVVLVSSAAAERGIANHEAIAAAKGAIISLTKSAAATYASQGLKVNAVAPGLTETKMTEKLTKDETSKKFSTAMHALGKLGQPNDVAEVIAFLMENKSDVLTGQVISVDAGLSSLMPKIRA